MNDLIIHFMHEWARISIVRTFQFPTDTLFFNLDIGFAIWTFDFPISIMRIFDFSMDPLSSYSDVYFTNRTFDLPIGYLNYLCDI